MSSDEKEKRELLVPVLRTAASQGSVRIWEAVVNDVLEPEQVGVACCTSRACGCMKHVEATYLPAAVLFRVVRYFDDVPLCGVVDETTFPWISHKLLMTFAPGSRLGLRHIWPGQGHTEGGREKQKSSHCEDRDRICAGDTACRRGKQSP